MIATQSTDCCEMQFMNTARIGWRCWSAYFGGDRHGGWWRLT